jgi:signal transduction histidine kinase
VRRLKDLIDNAVEMARLDTVDIRLQTEPSDPCEIVGEVVTSMRNEIDHRAVKIGCGENLRAIAADRRLLKLAMKQLINNALKYSTPGTPVTITVQNGSDAITIAVTNHGKGIPVQEQQRIFERLYRSPAVQNQTPGSGLGLSIARNIVRAHHGDLSVTSVPGETTFRLTLPPTPDAGQKGRGR